jgi:hypothetical protein
MNERLLTVLGGEVESDDLGGGGAGQFVRYDKRISFDTPGIGDGLPFFDAIEGARFMGGWVSVETLWDSSNTPTVFVGPLSLLNLPAANGGLLTFSLDVVNLDVGNGVIQVPQANSGAAFPWLFAASEPWLYGVRGSDGSPDDSVQGTGVLTMAVLLPGTP